MRAPRRSLTHNAGECNTMQENRENNRRRGQHAASLKHDAGCNTMRQNRQNNQKGITRAHSNMMRVQSGSTTRKDSREEARPRPAGRARGGREGGLCRACWRPRGHSFFRTQPHARAAALLSRAAQGRCAQWREQPPPAMPPHTPPPTSPARRRSPSSTSCFCGAAAAPNSSTPSWTAEQAELRPK